MRGWLVFTIWSYAVGIPLLFGVAAAYRGHDALVAYSLLVASWGFAGLRLSLECLAELGKEGPARLPEVGEHWKPPGDTRVRGT